MLTGAGVTSGRTALVAERATCYVRSCGSARPAAATVGKGVFSGVLAAVSRGTATLIGVVSIAFLALPVAGTTTRALGGASPASPGGSTAAGSCSKTEATRVVERLHLGNADDPDVSDPVAQVLCGSFVGPGSQAMVASLAIPSCGRTAGWVVLRRSGADWQLVMERNNGADLDAVGTGIRETQFVLRRGDAHCFPTGGTRSRTWRWNGTRFVSSPWTQSKPASPSTPVAGSSTDGYFKTPSGNIVCFHSVGPKDSPRAFLGCGIKSGLNPAPPRRPCDEGGYAGDRVECPPPAGCRCRGVPVTPGHSWGSRMRGARLRQDVARQRLSLHVCHHRAHVHQHERSRLLPEPRALESLLTIGEETRPWNEGTWLHVPGSVWEWPPSRRSPRRECSVGRAARRLPGVALPPRSRRWRSSSWAAAESPARPQGSRVRGGAPRRSPPARACSSPRRRSRARAFSAGAATAPAPADARSGSRALPPWRRSSSGRRRRRHLRRRPRSSRAATRAPVPVATASRSLSRLTPGACWSSRPRAASRSPVQAAVATATRSRSCRRQSSQTALSPPRAPRLAWSTGPVRRSPTS